MRIRTRVAVVLWGVLVVAVGQGAPAQPQASALWGREGEKWTPQGRLPDFSFAGYHSGEAPLPRVPVVKDLRKDYGAKGDGQADDTEAFLAAVRDARPGAIFIPEGRYKLTKIVQIRVSGVVLRGAGPDKTVLVVPEPLKDVAARQAPGAEWNFNKCLAQPEVPSASRKGPFNVDGDWRYRGGIVWVEGEDRGKKLADVASPAARGDKRLKLSGTKGIGAGQFVRVLQFDDADKSLGKYLYAGRGELGPELYQRTGPRVVDWAAKVVSVDDAGITLDRPLRVEVRPEWKPQVYAHEPTVQEVGIEGIGFEFPGVRYPGHLKETGFNAVFFKQVSNCWVKDVWVTDGDIAFNFEWMVRFSQVQDVRTLSKRRKEDHSRWGGAGHHAIEAAYLTQDCLFTRFRFDTHYVHDLSVDCLPNGNVFSKGSGMCVNFDHHRGGPYENLFTDIDVGDPSLLWASSGNLTVGPPAGARETFWNVRPHTAGATMPAAPDWPQLNLVGLPGYAPSLTQDKEWVEPIDPTTLVPQDLFEAQRARRLKSP